MSDTRDVVRPMLGADIARDFAELGRSERERLNADARPALQSFHQARQAVEARERTRLQSEEDRWRPRIQALAGPSGEPIAWPRLRQVLGLAARRRLARIQGYGAALAAAGLVVAALLGQQPDRSEWETLQANATPVPVVIREDGWPTEDSLPQITPWSLPGGAP